MGSADHRMFSIKLILPNHLKYSHFTDDFDGSDGKLPLTDAEG
jgi:hypothetical protein